MKTEKEILKFIDILDEQMEYLTPYLTTSEESKMTYWALLNRKGMLEWVLGRVDPRLDPITFN